MATIYTSRLIIVIQAGDKDAANAIALQTDPSAGTTFSVGLSATGNLPFTHYWCNWSMTASQDTDIRGRLNALINTGRVKLYDANVFTPEQVLTELGLRPLRPTT